MLFVVGVSGCTLYDYGPGQPPVIVPGTVVPPPPSAVSAPNPPPPPAPPIVRQEVTLRAKGAGAPPTRAANAAQARLMAERAAQVDGYRNLLEQTYGLQVVGSTTVRDFVTQSDMIRTQLDAFIRGAKIVDTHVRDDGSVETDMELTLGKEFWVLFPGR
ncbi:MAG: LPP20 family lipoprotein [candidate division NC10 bacterium]|nr:LPP20 family lipoprotein [candidate division NC10 bacterium]